MRRLNIFIVLISLLCSCVPLHIPVSSKYDWNYSMIKPLKSKSLYFADENIDITFLITPTQIGFQLKNKTEKAITINWDEMIFVSVNDESKRVIHSGIKLTDKNIIQAPTTIAPKTKILDNIIPTENIYYSQRERKWIEKDLFSSKNRADYVGDLFSIYMPLKIGDSNKTYTFTFKIEKVVKKKVKIEEEDEQW